MDSLSTWFKSNMDLVFFIYGLGFLTMAISIFVQPRKDSQFKLAGILWLLAGFCLMHGINEWLDMWVIIKGDNFIFEEYRVAALLISFGFLFEFGRRLTCLSIPEFSVLSKRRKIFKNFSWWMVVFIIFLMYVLSFEHSDFWETATTLVRYLFGFPGGILTGVGFILYYKRQKALLEKAKVKKYFVFAGLSFISYGFLGGIVVPKNDLFLPSLLNNDSFFSVVKIPVQAVRTICAIVGCWSVVGILKIFNWEKTKYLFSEIEERKLAEEELRRAKEFNETVFNSMNEGLVVIDPKDWKILKTNRAFLESLHLEERDAVGKHCYEVTHNRVKPCVPPDDICPLADTVKTGLFASAEHIHYDKEGIKKYIEVSTTPIKNSKGEIYQIVHISRDITEKKEAEETLKKSYHMQTIVDSILRISLENISIGEIFEFAIEKIVSIPWLLLEPRGVIFLVEQDNPGVLAMKASRGIGAYKQGVCARVPFGRCLCGRAAASGKIEFASCVDERHENDYRDIGAHGHYCVPIMSGGKVLGVFNLYLKDGHQRSQKEEDSLTALANILSEVIQRKRAEEELKRAYEKLKEVQAQLVQTAKMAVLGQLAGGVAHEINNPLTGVLNNVQLIKLLMQEKKELSFEEFSELLGIIEESALRCKKITASLLNFSHASMGAFKIIHINETVEKVFDLIGQEMKLQNIVIEKQLDLGLPPISGDSQLLQQVIFNLISNARWGIEKKGKGKITVKTENRPETNRVCVSIADTGIGIPKDKMDKLFEPFFTTKSVGEGTGLGLSVAYSIIKRHKGTIEAESRENEGATFRIYLPCVREK